ncbi:MAG TPA: hypothetical protein PKE19_04935, partial [Aestuariivirga sp.]|nr:hypothetical protein [Aestuariivirga sp.]
GGHLDTAFLRSANQRHAAGGRNLLDVETPAGQSSEFDVAVDDDFFRGRVANTTEEEAIYGMIWDTLYGGGEPNGFVNGQINQAIAAFKAEARLDLDAVGKVMAQVPVSPVRPAVSGVEQRPGEAKYRERAAACGGACACKTGAAES